MTSEEIENIRKNPQSVDWYYISQYQKLSEDFIREFKDSVDWDRISKYQKLSEDFIREFKDSVYWDNISKYQKLSEDFIREFKDSVDWHYISIYQKLSEDFIREFKDSVHWGFISKYQKLSEDFIREFKDSVHWGYISYSQKLSEDFILEFKLTISENNWQYKSKEFVFDFIKNKTSYEVVDDEVIAYKSCRSDGYSNYNFQYQYEVGKVYESHADSNVDNDNSFGLSAWTKEKAIDYCDEKLFKVAIKVEDIACIVHNGNKIRARKIRIVEEIV